MFASQNTASIHDTISHTTWMISNDYKSEYRSMHDPRSHTFYVNLNGYKSEYNIYAWQKITYILGESKPL